MRSLPVSDPKWLAKAEELASIAAHSEECDFYANERNADCDCGWRSQVKAIALALEEADEQGRADERRCPNVNIQGEDWYREAIAKAHAAGKAEGVADEGRLWVETCQGKRDMHSDGRVKTVADLEAKWKAEGRREGAEARDQEWLRIVGFWPDALAALPKATG